MNTQTLASAKQIAFIQKLMTERDYSGLNTVNIAEAIENGLNSHQASMIISLMLDCPKIAGAAPKVAEGFYLYNNDVYKVVKAKSTGNLYAKVLTVGESKGHWDYAPGIMKNLAHAEVLSLDVAKSMGHAHGICMICGATLTDPTSVEQGIGPVCAAKL